MSDYITGQPSHSEVIDKSAFQRGYIPYLGTDCADNRGFAVILNTLSDYSKQFYIEHKMCRKCAFINVKVQKSFYYQQVRS